MGYIVGLLGGRRLLEAVGVRRRGQGCLDRGLVVRIPPPAASVGPAGHSAPWAGHAAWTAGAACTGASSFAIRTRL